MVWKATTVASEEVSNVSPWALISEPLAIHRSGERMLVTGALGLFQAGLLEIALSDRDGEARETLSLGNFTPLEPCQIDKRVSCPNGAIQLGLRLRDSAGKLMGTIAELPLPV